MSDKVPEIPYFDEMAQIIKKYMPSDSAGICHGDFKMDNVLFHPTECKVLAIIDWEMSTIGHWGADIGNTLSPFYTPAQESPDSNQVNMGALLGLDLEELGLPEADDLLKVYYSTRNIPFPDVHVPYYVGFYWWKTAVICQGVAARSIKGQASSSQAKKVGAMTGIIGMLAYSKLSEVEDAFNEAEEEKKMTSKL